MTDQVPGSVIIIDRKGSLHLTFKGRKNTCSCKAQYLATYFPRVTSISNSEALSQVDSFTTASDKAN